MSKTVNNDVSMKMQCFAVNTDIQAELEMPSIRNGSDKALAQGHIVADTNVSPFARARNICCGHKFCVRDTKNVSDFVQKLFVCATNVSQFVQHGNTAFTLCPACCVSKKHHEQQRVRNNVSSFASTYMQQDKMSKFFILIVLELVLVVFLAQCKRTKHAWNNS